MSVYSSASHIPCFDFHTIPSIGPAKTKILKTFPEPGPKYQTGHQMMGLQKFRYDRNFVFIDIELFSRYFTLIPFIFLQAHLSVARNINPKRFSCFKTIAVQRTHTITGMKYHVYRHKKQKPHSLT